ncbi:MAG: zinc dependent phospholipase C family protein [Saprospiraceae bacterium]|nr:zinc dependent phospholipase C family protein [Saprospiraceae bacterium]
MKVFSTNGMTATLIAAALPFWGFFGHRLINEMAVYTLPPPLIGFYKAHIDYIRLHAVDPDKRRYAVAGEAERHFMDLDHWGKAPFADLPRDWQGAYWMHAEWRWSTSAGDTLWGVYDPKSRLLRWKVDSTRYDSLSIDPACVRSQFFAARSEGFAEQPVILGCLDTLWQERDWGTLTLRDTFSKHGVLPYHLLHSYRQLIRAFESGDVDRILRQSADLGHYIGDAHVPLHTTKNYNGQLSGQDGIHAFWESRLPELFAGQDYHFVVGRAEPIEGDPADYFWQIVMDSHGMVDSVLSEEAKLSASWPEDQQYCFEKRGSARLLVPCEAYSRAYHQSLNGQVGRRMRAAIKSLAAVWLSAWTAAGKPELTAFAAGSKISETDSLSLQDYEHLPRKQQH